MSQRLVVRIEVDDPSHVVPEAVAKSDPTVPGGWGMGIVDSYATTWGVDRHVGNGKTVWFEIDTTATAA